MKITISSKTYGLIAFLASVTVIKLSIEALFPIIRQILTAESVVAQIIYAVAAIAPIITCLFATITAVLTLLIALGLGDRLEIIIPPKRSRKS